MGTNQQIALKRGGRQGNRLLKQFAYSRTEMFSENICLTGKSKITLIHRVRAYRNQSICSIFCHKEETMSDNIQHRILLIQRLHPI